MIGDIFLIKGGKIATPDGIMKGCVRIEGGRIAAVSADLPADGADIVDASGMLVTPGLVDLHCHLREPGYEEKEDIASGTTAAAKGGFASICCMANTNPVNDNAVVTEFIKKKAALAGPVHVYPIAAITKNLAGEELTEVGELVEAGAAALSDDGKCVRNAQRMRLALSYAKRFGIRVISHPEDTDLTDGGLMNEGYWSTAIGLPGITRAAEETMIARDCTLAEVEHTGVHIAHVSTAGGAEIIRQAKRRGVRVTCETAPHYIYATDELVRGYDTNTKVNPPLRAEDDRRALIEALLDGTIDCIATDHAPHHADDKNVEYAIASSGISGFETAFSICWTVLVKGGYMTAEKLLEKMTSAPAKILGLDTGTIAPGCPADVAIIDPDAEWTVDPDKFASRGHNTPFGGRTLSGVVKCTIAGGKIAFGGEWACR
ncbi:MAG: dihydroorotase [Synergistaceae bacterium]|jgi:dihydroorotase|nr:dihydroorotase [Synergistaceae bacterium]